MADNWHSESCNLKLWTKIKDSIGSFPRKETIASQNGLPFGVENDQVVSEYLRSQKVYVDVLENAYRATCKCQAAVIFKNKKELSAFSETDTRILASRLITYVFFEVTPRKYNISEENFWSKLSKLKDFDEYHLADLKDFFRDSLFGRLDEHGFEAGAVSRFKEIINREIDDSEVWELEFNKLLCGDTNPEDLEFWKSAFFTNYKLFNPSISFEENVSKLKVKCMERQVVGKSSSQVHCTSCAGVGEFPTDDEDSFYGNLDEKSVTMDLASNGQECELVSGGGDGQTSVDKLEMSPSESYSPEPKRIKLADKTDEGIGEPSSSTATILPDSKINDTSVAQIVLSQDGSALSLDESLDKKTVDGSSIENVKPTYAETGFSCDALENQKSALNKDSAPADVACMPQENVAVVVATLTNDGKDISDKQCVKETTQDNSSKKLSLDVQVIIEAAKMRIQNQFMESFAHNKDACVNGTAAPGEDKVKKMTLESDEKGKDDLLERNSAVTAMDDKVTNGKLKDKSANAVAGDDNAVEKERKDDKAGDLKEHVKKEATCVNSGNAKLEVSANASVIQPKDSKVTTAEKQQEAQKASELATAAKPVVQTQVDPRMIKTDVNKAMRTALYLVDIAANKIEVCIQKRQYAYFFISIFRLMFQLKQKVCAAQKENEKQYLSDGAPKSRSKYQQEFQLMFSLMTVPNRELVEIGRGFYGVCVLLGDLTATE